MIPAIRKSTDRPLNMPIPLKSTQSKHLIWIWHLLEFVFSVLAVFMRGYQFLRNQNPKPTPSQKAYPEGETNQLNILFYTPDPPCPNKHGNRSRMIGLIRKFQEMGHTVHLALLQSSECDEDILQCIRKTLNVSVDIIPSIRFRVSLGFVPFDGWYERGIGECVRDFCEKYDIDAVLCSYVYQCKLLEYVPQHILKIIDTHDIMGNRSTMLRQNQIPIKQFSCTIEEESAYLRRADRIIGITREEAAYFEAISDPNKVIMISHLETPKFLKKKSASLHHVGIVASDNGFNFAMLKDFLAHIDQRVQDGQECEFLIHIIGDIKKQIVRKRVSRKMAVFKKPWVKIHGFVPDISRSYDQMDLIVSPMMCGTGINIKMVEALAYGMPLITTIHGARGIETTEPLHQHTTMDTLVNSLFTYPFDSDELERLSELSRSIYLRFHENNRAGLEALFSHPKLKV